MITQNGGNNGASIKQGFASTRYSDGAVATILQNGIASSADVDQRGGYFANASITQAAETSGNEASITQGGEYNVATITQSASSNSTTITQTGVGTAAKPNTVTVSQATAGNSANVAQSGGAGNSVTVHQ